jgi:hypothetical protein
MAVISFAVGTFLLAKPRQIQKWASKADNWPFQDYVLSPAYVVVTRLVGALFIAFAFFQAYVGYANP